MNVLLIIILTILITFISSINFHPELSQFEIRRLSSQSRKYKSLAKFIEIYPEFHLFANLVGLLAIILVSSVATITWGLASGSFISLIVVALAKLLGARLQKLTTKLIINKSQLLNKYFDWVQLFDVMVVKEPEPVITTLEELRNTLRTSKINDDTKQLIEDALHRQRVIAEKIATKWANVEKISYKDKLTPKRIDELFKSEQTIFPVVRKDDEDIVGLVHLSDISTVGQSEKDLLTTMQSNIVYCESTDTIPDILKQLAKNETTVAIVKKSKKIYGLVSLSDILSTDKLNRH